MAVNLLPCICEEKTKTYLMEKKIKCKYFKKTLIPNPSKKNVIGKKMVKTEIAFTLINILIETE